MHTTEISAQTHKRSPVSWELADGYASFHREIARSAMSGVETAAFRFLPRAREAFLKSETDGPLVDFSRPNLGIFVPCGFEAAYLFALAAQEQRALGMPGANVFFLPHPESVPLGIVRDDRGRVTVHAMTAAMIDGAGVCRVVSFDTPLRIDLVTTLQDSASPLHRWLESRGVPLLTSSEALATCRDKSETKKLLDSLYLRTPAWIRGDGPELSAAEKYRIESFRRGTAREGVVLKPLDENCGTGVLLIEKGDDRRFWQGIQTITQKFNSFLVESRVRSARLFGEHGERLDWNLRVLFSTGFIDWEARVGNWGSPVNKATGARIEEVSAVFGRLTDFPLTVEGAHRQVTDLVRLLSRALGGGLYGLDLIFDQEGRMWIVEINADSVGGFGSLVEIREGRGRLESCRRFVEQLGEAMVRRRGADIVADVRPEYMPTVDLRGLKARLDMLERVESNVPPHERTTELREALEAEWLRLASDVGRLVEGAEPEMRVDLQGVATDILDRLILSQRCELAQRIIRQLKPVVDSSWIAGFEAEVFYMLGFEGEGRDAFLSALSPDSPGLSLERYQQALDIAFSRNDLELIERAKLYAELSPGYYWDVFRGLLFMHENGVTEGPPPKSPLHDVKP